VLASAAGETEAYPGLLAAIGESLSCAGALSLRSDDDGELRCGETWPAGAAAGASPVGEAWASGGPASELAAQALANANAREELAASRSRLVAAGDAERGLEPAVEVLGGRFVLTSPPGAGTTLRAEIPVASGS
jgi:hypothetical protein